MARNVRLRVRVKLVRHRLGAAIGGVRSDGHEGIATAAPEAVRVVDARVKRREAAAFQQHDGVFVALSCLCGEDDDVVVVAWLHERPCDPVECSLRPAAYVGDVA